MSPDPDIKQLLKLIVSTLLRLLADWLGHDTNL
jgi:hypothetical protein